jgi:hypothetical protein
LRAGGYPRHALRLRDSDEAHIEAMSGALVADGWGLMSQIHERLGGASPAHRALPDARPEFQVWEEIGG